MTNISVQKPKYIIDGNQPAEVLAPISESECVTLVKEAAGTGISLVPVGGGMALQQGNRISSNNWSVVSMESMSNLSEYSPDDMVVTAQAGMPFALLQDELAKHGQFIPLDPAFTSVGTVGGVVACNAYGLWRSAYGTPRDRLLGLRVVLSNGDTVRAGGKVVKNVAGYDLCKLFAGSWGTLGLITEVTFKTNPLPSARKHLCYSGGNVAQTVAAALAIYQNRLEPAYLCVTCDSNSSVLVVGLHGSIKATDWQVQSAFSHIDERGLSEIGTGASENGVRHYVAGQDAVAKLRIKVRSTDLPDVCRQLTEYTSRLLCYVSNGVIEASLSLTESPTAEEFQSARKAIQGIVGDKGDMTWTRIPAQWKDGLDVWSMAPQRNASLMRGIKQALDPVGLFSPGRFIGGI